MCNKNRPLDNVMSVVEEVRQIFEFNIITIKNTIERSFYFQFFFDKISYNDLVRLNRKKKIDFDSDGHNRNGRKRGASQQGSILLIP